MATRLRLAWPPHEQLHRAPGLTKLGLQILHQIPGAGPIARITRDRLIFAFSDLGKWLTVYHGVYHTLEATLATSAECRHLDILPDLNLLRGL